MRDFDENKHPRASDGKFTNGNGGNDGDGGYSDGVNKRINWAKENGIELPLNEDGSVDDLKLQELYEANAEKKKTSAEKIVEVDMDAEVQKRLSAAETPKERQKIAFQYIMDNLRGQYAASDGRTVSIERVGADKITHHDMDVKLRVSPHLADFIKAGKLEGVVEAKKEDGHPHKLFSQFAYYKVAFKIGDDLFFGRLNVGIRKDGSATLYDLNPYQKQ